MKRPPASAPTARGTSNGALDRWREPERHSWLAPLLRRASAREPATLRGRLFVGRNDFRSKPQVMNENTNQSADDGKIPQPFQRRLPQLDGPRYMGILRQSP